MKDAHADMLTAIPLKGCTLWHAQHSVLSNFAFLKSSSDTQVSVRAEQNSEAAIALVLDPFTHCSTSVHSTSQEGPSPEPWNSLSWGWVAGGFKPRGSGLPAFSKMFSHFSGIASCSLLPTLTAKIRIQRNTSSYLRAIQPRSPLSD